MSKSFFFFLMLFLFASCANEKEETGIVHEKHRPGFHFTPPAHWMNDPNGMVYFGGVFHLFYQYYPDSTVWGPMHWGHATSRDLLHWEHQPIALYPDSLGYIFSGSAVADFSNTAGFGGTDQPAMVAVYTQHNVVAEKAGRNDFQSQSIAFSIDEGKTWNKYEGNPVMRNTRQQRDWRDPKVFWYEPAKRWVMVLAAGDHIELWNSPDLKSWKYLSDFGKGIGAHGGVWECPDLFPMKVGDTDTIKWVLIQNLNPGHPLGGSGTQYFIGDFDGTVFKLDRTFALSLEKEGAFWLDWGPDNYAGVTWSDIPVNDGRRIFLGWMSNWLYGQQVPTTPWRSAMTIPRVLKFRQTQNGVRLVSNPVPELESLRRSWMELDSFTVSGDEKVTLKQGIRPSGMEMEFDVEWNQDDSSHFGIRLSNKKGEYYAIGFDQGENKFFSDRTHSGKTDFAKGFADSVHWFPRWQTEPKVRVHVYFDVASCEWFTDQGEVCFTTIFFPSEDFDQLTFFSEGGEVAIPYCRIFGISQ